MTSRRWEPILSFTAQVTSKVWREVLAKQRTALAASLTGEIRYMESKFVIVELLIFVARVEPGIQALAGFFQYFDTEQV